MLLSWAHRRVTWLMVVSAVLAVLISGAGLGAAQGKGDSRAQVTPAAALATSVLDPMVLAKAPVDECFPADGSVGVRPITYPDANGNCPEGFVPKRNEAYVWGLTKTGENLWFGTASNVVCGVYSGYLEQTEPTYVEGDYVCETGATSTADGTTKITSDGRTPSIYRYDLAAKELTHVAGPDPSDHGAAHAWFDGWTTTAMTMLKATSGFRSAGSLGNTVILAGPGRYVDDAGTVQAKAALNFFAFNATTKELLAVKSVPGYSNIRKWLTYDPTPGDDDPGQLYAGIGTGSSGAVIRWLPTAEDPLNFVVVGTTGSEIAELVVHEGRIFGASWPSHPTKAQGYPDLTKEVVAGLYMSPVIPDGGFTGSNPPAWEKVWSANDYEPDAVTATTYGTGALASFDGYLYWGTMQVPGRGSLVHDDYYPPDPAQPADTSTFTNTLRAITIFRGRDFATGSEQQQVVYGQRQLPTWDVATSSWVNQPTKMGTPVWGSAGFGNPLNNYTWTMDVYHGSLYIGTMDFGYLGRQAFPADVQDLLDQLGYSFGADLFRIDSSSARGVFESKGGVGNITNYGIRTMVADDALYLGTANPMNLNPQGGWELLRLRPRYALHVSTSPDATTTGALRSVTATIAPAKEGVTVAFHVTGANPTPADVEVKTDADGVATWSYTGAVPGTDKVTATADSMGYGYAADRLEATTTANWEAAVQPAPEQPITPTAEQPDGWIRKALSGFIGNDIYDTTADRQTVRRSAHRNGVRTFWVRVYNDGTHAATFSVKGTDRARRANVQYFAGGTNVTPAMRSAAGWSFTASPGEYRTIQVQVRIGRHAAIGSQKSALVSMTSTGNGVVRNDAVKAVVTVR